VSPSTLASAYRATTHFTSRDGVAEPPMAMITRRANRVFEPRAEGSLWTDGRR
jgi:hypothetical protein